MFKPWLAHSREEFEVILEPNYLYTYTNKFATFQCKPQTILELEALLETSDINQHIKVYVSLDDDNIKI